ncbi:ribonuclease P protein component [Paenibacillus validus]|uniref:ribonuclease P protein component n=1 Tax=Paenibacillus TaxID=44249 RepID=UPI0006D1CAFA|nr:MULTISPECIES: ribonuclease P protein component [Paenibacillus]MED4600599.1 ribonuclease P protein component [Paenibacillus validus]MED4605608.1 ribonuclease P protein component [Paenibacillus validus]
MEKKNRLTKREYFDKVYKHGKSSANHQFVLYYKAQPQQASFRLGVSVSKKLGNAVVRNRIRRVLKEIIRLNAPKIPGGYDLILIARKPVVEMSYREIEKSVFHVLKRASLLRRNGEPKQAD